MNKFSLFAALTLSFSSTNSMAAGRDYIGVVGSSSIDPFATVVAETFGKKPGLKHPKLSPQD